MPSSYAAITREWRDGDRVDIELPMRTTLERLPDNSDYVAILRGPIVLAAKTGSEQLGSLIAGDGRMAHISPGPYLPLDSAPMLVGDEATLTDHIRPIKRRPMTFTASDIIRPAQSPGLELVPFFRVHDSRYVIYWRAVPPAEYSHVVSRLATEEKGRLALETRTLDRVTPGEQQPEIEHQVRGEGATTGVTNGRSWRDASGWFSYELTLLAERTGGPLSLLVTYSAGQRDRQFDILVNDREIGTVTLTGQQPDRFTDVAYPIPEDIVKAAKGGVLIVKFAAKSGSRAGAVYDVRLLAAQ
jgi:hypothetical protein